MHVFKRTLGENSIGGQQISECTPQCVSVKNTFIDDWIDADNSPADERIVQSMPHNMFGQCLSAQLSGYSPPQKNGNDLADLTTSNKDAACEVSHLVGGTLEEEELIALGTEVVIDGLVKAPSFNGAMVSCNLGMQRPAATMCYWRPRQPMDSVGQRSRARTSSRLSGVDSLSVGFLDQDHQGRALR